MRTRTASAVAAGSWAGVLIRHGAPIAWNSHSAVRGAACAGFSALGIGLDFRESVVEPQARERRPGDHTDVERVDVPADGDGCDAALEQALVAGCGRVRL